MKILPSLLVITTLAVSPASVAAAASLLFIPGGSQPGFLSLSTAKFVVENFSPNSNNFTSGNGWTAAEANSSSPTITTVSDTLPDGTTGNVSEAVFPAISAGTSAISVLTFSDTNLLGPIPLSHSVWAKVVSGTGTLFDSISRGTIFADAPITNDGNWHLIQATWVGASLGTGNNNVGISIGINQNFSTERTAVGSITVEFAGDYFVELQSANVPSFSDVKTGGSIATTGTPPITAQLTEPFPAHVNIRDPSQWTNYSGNPFIEGDPAEVWGSGGRGNPVIQSQFQSGGFFWAFNGQCFGTLSSQDIISQCLYSSPTTGPNAGLVWTEDTTNAPYLFVVGGIFANPTVSSAGSGFTASASGTATYTGNTATCAVAPVIAITTNSSGAIASATPSPNNGIGTGSCGPWPTASDTGWSFSGVGSGSGATFTFAEVTGTSAAPAPAKLVLHPQFLPFGCSDGTNPHIFCIIWSAEDTTNAGHLYMAWSDGNNGLPDGVYTPIGCAGPGMCSTATPVTELNLPLSGYQNQGVPTIVNVGGATGTNYIYAYAGGGSGIEGVRYAIFTTPASSSNTTSGNTLTFVHDAGFTIVTGLDWYAPIAGTIIGDDGIFLNHCGFYEFYFQFSNSSVPVPPWPAGVPADTQMVGEAVSKPDVNGAPTNPWYQFTQPIFLGNSINPTGNGGDPAPIELSGQFIITQPFNAPNGTGAGFALTGPQGTCP